MSRIFGTSAAHELIFEGLQGRVDRGAMTVEQARDEARRLELPEALVTQLAEKVGTVKHGAQSQVVQRRHDVPSSSPGRGAAAIHAACPPQGQRAQADVKTATLRDLPDLDISGPLQQATRNAARNLKVAGIERVTVLGIYTLGSEPLAGALDAVSRHAYELIQHARDERAGAKVGVFSRGLLESLEQARNFMTTIGRPRMPAVEIDVSGAEPLLRFTTISS